MARCLSLAAHRAPHRATRVRLLATSALQIGRRAVAADRRFSECILYGRYVDEVLAGRGHFHDDRAFCHVLWFGHELDTGGLEKLIAEMEAHQVAIGIQSFIETDLEPLRRMIR